MKVGGVALVTWSSLEYNLTSAALGFVPSKLALDPTCAIDASIEITG